MRGRRDFLKTLAGGVAGAAVPCLFTRETLAEPAAASLAVDRLTDNLYLIHGAGGNVIALTGREGVLLVDSGSKERARDLLRAVAALPGAGPVRTVFNTHWHWDHTGGNELVRQGGATVIAHENTRLWLGATIWEEWQNRTYAPRPREAWPTQTFYTAGKMTFGDEPIEYGYLPQAHTDGDLYVYFRRQNVLAAGCVVSAGHYPVLDYCTGGWIGGMADATEKLAQLSDEKTRIVPGFGPVQTRAEVAAEQQMLATLRDDLWQLVRKGFNGEDLLAAGATRKFDPQWGDPTQFVESAYRGLYAHVREMRGVV